MPASPDRRLHALIRTFPTLSEYTPPDPELFDAAEFMCFVQHVRPGSGMQAAAAFVLDLWKGGSAFDLRYSWSAWDERHRAAWLAWAAAPWWP